MLPSADTYESLFQLIHLQQTLEKPQEEAASHD